MSAAKITRPVRPEEHFATKADIADLRTDIANSERRLELKIADSEKRLELKIAALKTDMTHLEKRLEVKIADSERRLEVKIEQLRGEMHSNTNRIILWFVGVLFASQALLFTAIASVKWF